MKKTGEAQEKQGGKASIWINETKFLHFTSPFINQSSFPFVLTVISKADYYSQIKSEGAVRENEYFLGS